MGDNFSAVQLPIPHSALIPFRRFCFNATIHIITKNFTERWIRYQMVGSGHVYLICTSINNVRTYLLVSRDICVRWFSLEGECRDLSGVIRWKWYAFANTTPVTVRRQGWIFHCFQKKNSLGRTISWKILRLRTCNRYKCDRTRAASEWLFDMWKIVAALGIGNMFTNVFDICLGLC